MELNSPNTLNLNRTPVFDRNEVLLIKQISWSVLLILKGTVMFQVHVTTELGPILENMPRPKAWSNKTQAFPVFIFFYLQVFVMFLASTSMMYYHYDAIRGQT